MKRSFILAIPFLLSSLIMMGQSTKKSHWLLISVFENVSLIPHSTMNIVVTSDDGTQKLTVIKRNPGYTLKQFKENEDSVFAMLQPYFADGWKLTGTNTIPVPQSPGGFDYLTRYFLCKEE